MSLTGKTMTFPSWDCPAEAARNLYTGRTNPQVVSRLLENRRFAQLTNMIALYFDDTLASGFAVQNQIFQTLSSWLLGTGKEQPVPESRPSKQRRLHC